MLVAAAFVPTPPLLVPELAGGSAASDERLRASCRTAVNRLLTTALDELVIVGPAPTDGPQRGSWDWRGFGVPLPATAPAERLPLALAIGSWLLDDAGADTPRTFHGITAQRSPAACAARGAELVAGARRVGLLVCGDGSACRTEKAPGFYDPGSAAWDDAAIRALRQPDPQALLALDVETARRVLAAGRAPWQVLAGAAADDAFEATVDWADAPYGVMYIAGTWTRPKDDLTR